MQRSLYSVLWSAFLGTVLAGRPFTAKQPTFYSFVDSPLKLPRGGDIPSGSNIYNRVKSFLWDAPPPPPKPDKNVWKVAGDFFQKQTTAAQERREFYQQNANQVQTYAKNVFKPERIIKLTVSAFVVAELVEFILGNQGLQTFWTSTLHPALLGRFSQVKVWWTKGRAKGGLFHPDTWTRAKQNKKPQIVIKAWNQQFSPKYQRAIGLAAGLIASPILWSLTSVVGVYLGAGIAVAELNHYLGQHIQDLLQPLSGPLSKGWTGVDNALEQVHGRFWDLIKRPTIVVQSLVKDLDERIPDELVPVTVQQGMLVGALLGFVAGI